MAPITIGDVVRGYLVIGTTAAFVSQWGGLPPVEGRNLEKKGEAVIAADVQLAIGDWVTPAHGIAGRRRPGEDSDDEAEHRHAGLEYTVVGRKGRLGTPCDRAILVPVESVWENARPQQRTHAGGRASRGSFSKATEFRACLPWS